MAKLSQDELRQFRTKVSTLKKQGLIPRSIDARAANPTSKSAGKKLSTIVDKFDDILSGKATAVKVTPAQLRSLRKAGFETTHGRAIIPHSATETAKLKRGQVAITSKTGMERVVLPIEFHDLPQYLRDARANKDVINAMKKRNEYFGIRLHGGQRANFYGDIDSLLEDLSRYEAFMAPGTKPQQQDLYRHLEILKLNRRGALAVEEKVANRNPGKSTSKQKRGFKGFKSAKAAAARNYRATLKGKKLEAYKTAARKRAAKSRRKKKNGKRKRK